MADGANAKVNITGIVPMEQGEDPRYGNWFLIDENGEFTLDSTVIATIWLVGGGSDGTAGVWNGNTVESAGKPIPDTGTGDSYGGKGGDGGCVFTAMNVTIPKGATLSATIAENNDKTGTTLDVDGVLYKCNQAGYILRSGGSAGHIPTASQGEKYADQNDAVSSGNGFDGVLTPYGYVGSSGGGGAVCNGETNAENGVKGGEGAGAGTNHRGKGTDASNYGCGGGGGAICGYIAQGQEGGLGKQGCIIIAYTVAQNTLIVQKHYKRVCDTNNVCKTDYYTNSSSKTCCCGNGCGCNKSPYASDYIDNIHIHTIS